MVITSISLSPLPIPSIFNPKPSHSFKSHNSSPSITATRLLPAILSSKRTNHHSHNSPPHAIPLKTTQKWRIYAIPGDILLSEANPVENSEQIVSTNDDGAATIISVLLFLAFVGLSILTIGVIYIAVTDFLQKREREKFEKEEAAKKKGGKKRKVRARAGPRGFGQKIDDVYDDVDDV